MKQTTIEKSVDVQLTVTKVIVNNKEFKNLKITFEDGFTLRVSPTFDLTPKEWGKFQYILDEILGEDHNE